MKYIYTLIAIIAFSISTQAQVLEDIITHKWTGASEAAANFTKSGRVYLTQSFSFSLNRSDYSLSGTAISTMNLDGVVYKAKCNLKGYLYTDKNQIWYRAEYVNGDQLPNGLQWCPSWGYLTFYRNSGKSGYYLLKGTVEDSCGGRGDVELGDD